MGIKTQGTTLSVETARAATKAITGITNASPPVITATGSNYSAGDKLLLANIQGMQELNNCVIVVANPTADSFQAKGLDSTSFGAYTTGGDSYKLTLTSVGTVTGIPTLFSGTAAEIKTTHLHSVAEEKEVGLPDFGSSNFDIITDTSDAGQAAANASLRVGSTLGWTVKLVNGKEAPFYAFVKSAPFALPQNEVVRQTIGLTLKAAPNPFV
jgi:hypothetical protein